MTGLEDMTSLPWWVNAVACPHCGADLKLDAARDGRCSRCGARFSLADGRIKWEVESAALPEAPKERPSRSLLRRAVDPLSSPFSPLRHLTDYRVRRYYARTKADRKLALAWQAHYLAQLNLPAGARALDHGCGKGRNIGILNQLGFRTAGQDVAADRWWKNFPGTAFQVVPPAAPRLPWRTGSFELVLDFGVLGFVPEQRTAAFIDEVKRVLAPGGYWLILEANERGYGRRWFQQRLVSLEAILANARSSGFVEMSTSFEGFYAPVLPGFVNFVRKQCAPWTFDLSDHGSWLARRTPPEKRGLWLLHLRKTDK